MLSVLLALVLATPAVFAQSVPVDEIDHAAVKAAPLHALLGARFAPAAFYQAIGITVPGNRQSQFVSGDHVNGYLESYTHAWQKGAGYLIGDSTVLRGYASMRDGRLNLREHKDARETVLPYGHRVRYRNGMVEQMALLGGSRSLAIELHGARAAHLTVLPLTAMTPEQYQMRRIGNAVVLVPHEAVSDPHYLYAAFSADRPFEFSAGDAPAPLRQRTLQLRSRAPVTSFTVVASFAATPEQAARMAEQQAMADPLRREQQLRYERLNKSLLWTDDALYNRSLAWAKAAADLFVVDEFGAGIWAGLPWFRQNWGRDTFIALPGTLLVAGQFSEAKRVLENFARYQNLKDPQDKDYGRIPNRISADDIIYNTVDGTPWMLREALETIRYTGDRAFAARMLTLARAYFDGAQRHGVDADGLLTHDDADTWMDARIEGKQAWSARGPRAVEIQALWYTALQTGAALADEAGDADSAHRWRAQANTTRDSFLRLFWDGATMADRLRADGSRDLKVRPNQLMLISIPFDDFIPPPVQARVTRNAVSELLYPYGIASLSQNDPYFHPRHVNDDFHHKDAAYHQGTVWGWNAGFTVTALNKFGYQDLAYALERNLGRQMLSLGTLGNMSELLDALPDAAGNNKPSGTYAQSWSVAEFARNGYQDFVGFRPDLLANALRFVPAIPHAWKHFDALLPYGDDESVRVAFHRLRDGQQWRFVVQGKSARRLSMRYLRADRSRAVAEFDLQPGVPAVLALRQGRAYLNGKRIADLPVQASYSAEMGDLKFQLPKQYRAQDFPMLQQIDRLKGIVERNEYR
jgi:glycogen debranching enzyme